MKRLGVLGVGLVVGVVAACGGEDEPGAQSSSSGGSSGTTDGGGSTSSSGQTACPERAPLDPSCNVTKCTADLGGPAICVAGACKALTLGEECVAANIFGAANDDNAIWIGGMTGFITGDPAAPVDSSGPPQRNSIELAVREINESGGIPPVDTTCGSARPLAAIVCDDGGWRTEDITLKVGHHLVDDLGITAIVGANWSGTSIALAKNVTSPKKALLFAPGSTAIDITNLPEATVDGKRLLWRTAPSDILQGAALLQVLAQVSSGTVKVAVVNIDNAYGVGLGGAVAAGSINGAPMTAPANAANFAHLTYDPSAPDADAQMAQVKTDLLALNPNVVVIIGTNEVASIIDDYDGDAVTKPTYLLSDGTAVPELWTSVANNPSLATRIRGTVPGAITPLTKSWFDFNYKTAFPQGPNEKGTMVPSTLVFGMAGCYDATYLLAYAMMSSQTADSKVFTGPMLADGLAKTIGGAPVDVGKANFSAGSNAMRSGAAIDFTGTSGPLDFDIAHGEAPSDLIVWCVKKNPNTNSYERADDTGQTYVASSSSLQGPFACPQ